MKIKSPEIMVRLPDDELPHKDQAIEWWYFNGFLESVDNSKNRYAFMTCLFKAEKDKVNLKFLKLPYNTIYFSHSLLYNLTTGKVKKEILPFVILSGDSFSRKELFVNYMYPIRKSFVNYEIARMNDRLRVKTEFFDLSMAEKKQPLLENVTGFIDLGKKTTYYYTYPNMDVEGYVGNEKVIGKAWHDKQWSDKGFMRDSWLWFSFQLEDNTEIVCFDYMGKRMATISHPDNSQETVDVTFKPLGKVWKSDTTKIRYELEWEVKIKDITITTKPFMQENEMNFGFINYWEGPVSLVVKGHIAKSGKGFMEYLSEAKDRKADDILSNHISSATDFYEKNKNGLLSKLRYIEGNITNIGKDIKDKFNGKKSK